LVFYSTVTVTAILCAKNRASQCISASRLHPNHLAHTNTPTLLLGFVSTPATWLDWGCRARAPPPLRGYATDATWSEIGIYRIPAAAYWQSTGY